MNFAVCNVYLPSSVEQLLWMEFQHMLWVPSFQEDETAQTLSMCD